MSLTLRTRPSSHNEYLRKIQQNLQGILKGEKSYESESSKAGMQELTNQKFKKCIVNALSILVGKLPGSSPGGSREFEAGTAGEDQETTA